MKKQSFTAQRIQTFSCETGRQQSIYSDAKTPGLGLRVTKAGSKAYIFEARLHGKNLRITIGDIRTWSIGQAQAEATRLKNLVDQGIDPREQKAKQHAQAETARAESKRKILTVGEVWPIYLEARKARWSERHYYDHIKLAAPGGLARKRGSGLTTAGPLAPLLPLALTELDSKTVAAWLDSESATRPTNAAQSYRLLRAFIRWAADMPDFSGLIPADTYNARIVREAVPKNKAKEGDALQCEQLMLWFDSVRKIRNPVISAYLQALLLTGARREEMAALRWEDMDIQWGKMTIRDKIEGQRTIPLPPYLAKLLAELPRRNAWVFSSPTAADGKIAEPRIAHTKALQEAGLPHVTLHGLRRSFGSLCEWVEMPAGIIAQIMGHKPNAIAEKHYRRRSIDLLRRWHDQAETWILEKAGVEFEPNVEAKRLHLQLVA